VDIPESINSTVSAFTLQAGRDLLAALKAQDQANTTAEDFQKTLEATNAITDNLEITSISPALNADPTSSTLFQAHLGTLASSQASADSALSAEDHTQLKVTGIGATTATGPFANGRSPQPEYFQPELPGVEPSQASRYPAVDGADGFSGTYGMAMNRQIGVRLDLRG
jgi:hypothetical protein